MQSNVQKTILKSFAFADKISKAVVEQALDEAQRLFDSLMQEYFGWVQMKVLFWNTHKNSKINYYLESLIIENDINVAVLAEYKADILGLNVGLSKHGKRMIQYVTPGCERIKIIGEQYNVEPAFQSRYVSMQIFNKNNILCGVHFPSQIYSGNRGMRDIVIQQTIKEICNLEEELKTKNTIIVGDFNINPFDSECIDANMLHGLPIYEDTKRGSRIIAGQEFYMFYNPMWNFLGDFKHPYGTYYYSGCESNNTYWKLYDQVIIRPALRKRFIDKSLAIVTETQSNYLLDDKGHPDKNISDHLPIIFEIKEDYYGQET